MTYVRHFNTRQTPPSQPIPGSSQVPNSAGGYAWAVDDWTRLQRFLLLGSEGGTYYIGERKLTVDNAQAVLRCLKDDGPRVVQEVVSVSQAGRAPKNEPALFVLAMAAGLGDQKTKKLALESLPEVARIGTHLFAFAEAAQAFRGWGRGLRSAVAGWYTAKEPARLAYQLAKYQQRNGWSHRDLLRLSHPVPATGSHKTLYHWATQGWNGVGPEPHPDPNLQLVWAMERAKKAGPGEIVQLINAYGLTREMLPTEALNDLHVWMALLAGMPLGALVRNLGKMTQIGLLKPLSLAASFAVDQLRDQATIRKSRLHPMAVLLALRTYAGGRGLRGKLSWQPVPQIVDALNEAFYLAFQNVEATGKRILLGVDVSGSMRGTMCAGSDISAAEAAAAQALVLANVEPNHFILAFDTEPKTLAITPKMRLDQATQAVDRLINGGTDCAVPVAYALVHKIEVDAFVILTDSETWAGRVHPQQAIQRYRQEMGRPAAKLVVVAMCANRYTIGDPGDAGVLQVVGFDASVPQVVADFIGRSS